MRLTILGNTGGTCRGSLSTCAMLDDCILIDAGTGAHNLSLEEMRAVNDIVLTHSHLDHTAMLCFLVECRIGVADELTVHCLAETAQAIRDGLLNDLIWPDFENIVINGKQMIRFHIIKPYEPFEINGRRFTPLPVRHTVPTLAYCLHGEQENFLFIADIGGADDKLTQWINRLDKFKTLIIELSFPDGMEKLAADSAHLTPALLEDFLRQIPSAVRVHFCHVKPQYEDEIKKQAAARFGGKVTMLQQGQIFDF